MNAQAQRADPPWDIRREGRAWTTEALSRAMVAPEPELIDGMLVYEGEDRLTLPAPLLEHVGVDAAVRIGSPATWRAAVDSLEVD